MLDRLGLAAASVAYTTHRGLPADVEPLLDAILGMGGERDESAARLAAYQDLVVAGCAG